MPNYRAMALAAAKSHGIDPRIFLAQINQESGFQPNRTSSAGAEGIAQFMPGTAASYHIDPFNPQQALNAAAQYDASELKAFHGNWGEALGAYNAGAGNASHYNDPNFAGGQTYNYVRSILGAAHEPLNATGTISQGNQPRATAGQVPGLSQLPTSLLNNSNAIQRINQLIGMQMSNNAAQTVATGHITTGNPQSLAALASLRSQYELAASQHGALPGAPTPHATAGPGGATPDVHGGWSGKLLAGNLPMVFGGKSPYSNLRFDSNVDWQHVNPRLLRAMNQVAANSGKVITINSGYRSDKYSQQVGGFAGDPHTKGIAVDAYVNGAPVGHVFGPQVWGKYGVRSGDTFNYKGSADPEHLDLVS